MRRVNVLAAATSVSLGLLAALPAGAQTVTAYEGARLIVGDGSVVDNGTIVVDGSRIVAGRQRTSAFPPAPRASISPARP